MSGDPGIDPAVPPSGPGCVECLATPDGWWFHLRRCARCGHVGCCDSSPSQHASRHADSSGHPIVRSYEPGEDWFYDYTTDEAFLGMMVKVLAPYAWSFADDPEVLSWLGQLAAKGKGEKADLDALRSSLKLIEKYVRERGLPR